MQSVTPQNCHVQILTQDFLSVHWDRKSPLLLGYSGGPDSKALLYSLIECGVKPHIAHIDHGWREVSCIEAEQLRAEAEQLGCPFFSTRLEKKMGEDEARRARLAFFASIYSGCQALLLAHHADDLAETVLKRVLEGAHLAHLSGMQEVSQQFSMNIWRPLLKIKKSEILKYLQERELNPLIDSSNFDPTYLRSRMRMEIFPFLNERFGKQTTENLTLLSERAAELKKYLDKKVSEVKVQKGPWGTLVDLNGLERVEQRHLIQKIAAKESLILKRDHIDTLLSWVADRKKSKVFMLGSKKFLVDMGRICMISLPPKD
ncbi:MAG: tRNA lysidine(34) synthetase TilS [Chlamydiae bacterium CG10_big_fil_rev_8_21_14_0_10_42_34]|nr:MAG: tRNA lysidine(34) synthetase TilS [Chlamydiae bacterium CG10_big_fil_rev_8_21_14_0_10_42_34]